MSAITFHVKDFGELGKCFRYGNFSLSLTDLNLDGKALDSRWSAQLVQKENDAAFISIKGSHNAEGLLAIAPFAAKTASKFTKLTAVIDHQLEVEFDFLQASLVTMTVNQSATIKLSFNSCRTPLSVLPDQDESVYISAILPETVLRSANSTITKHDSTDLIDEFEPHESLETLKGTLGIYKFIVRPLGDDLKIIIRSADGLKSPSASVDKAFFEHLLEGLRWINGGSQFAYLFSHRRDFSQIETWAQTPQIERIKPRLVSSQPHNDNVLIFLEKIAEFGEQQPARFKELRTYLWQYRDASSDNIITWGKISQIAALNEGIVGLILKHTCSHSATQIKKLIAPASIDPDQRKGSAKARFYYAATTVGLEWADFEEVFETWKTARNPLAHGDYSSIEEWLKTGAVDTYRKLVNSFNWLALRYIDVPLDRIRIDHQWFPLG